jgi:hypothetical protein
MSLSATRQHPKSATILARFEGAVIALFSTRLRAEFWSSLARSFTILSLTVLARQESMRR